MKCSDCGKAFEQAPWQVAARNPYCKSCRSETARSKLAEASADARFADAVRGSVSGWDYLQAYREGMS